MFDQLTLGAVAPGPKKSILLLDHSKELEEHYRDLQILHYQTDQTSVCREEILLAPLAKTCYNKVRRF
jgi:hypothetical protein